MDILPALQPGRLVVVYARHAARNEISHVIAELALRRPVTVLDGGNRFQAYRIAHLLRLRTAKNLDNAARRLFVRRAFTCYQMLALLENTPSLHQPYLVLDLLATFYDEQVQPREAHRLLDACLRQVDRLRQFAPLAITLGIPMLEDRQSLIEKVCRSATTVFMEEATSPQEIQFPLF